MIASEYYRAKFLFLCRVLFIAIARNEFDVNRQAVARTRSDLDDDRVGRFITSFKSKFLFVASVTSFMRNPAAATEID